jgi:hypothetical protein
MASPFDKFYSGDMAPPTRVNGALVPTSNETNWNDFYGSVGITGKEPAGSELISRSVKTVAIDPFTGQPIAAGGAKPNSATMEALYANMKGRGQPPRMSYIDPSLGNQRLAAGSEGLPLNTSGGQYGAGNPLVMSALTAQQKANPAVDAATAMASGGNIKPGWANPAGINSGPKFPVASTPQIEIAYADMVAGKPGAMDRYGKLLADQAGQGNIRISSGGGDGGSSGGGSSSSSVPAGQPVKIATGKTATSGQTYQQGANGAGKPYTYQVQPNGSIKNLTTGRITAPATR